MSVSQQYAEAVHKTQSAWTEAADSWTQNLTSMFGRSPAGPVVPGDPTTFVDQWFDFAEHLLKLNRDYAQQVTGAIQGAARQEFETVGNAVREQFDAGVTASREQADLVQRTVHQQAAEAEKADRAEAKQSRKADYHAAAERYAELTKAQLQDQLADRDLPKTGNVDELRERLIEADLQK